MSSLHLKFREDDLSPSPCCECERPSQSCLPNGCDHLPGFCHYCGRLISKEETNACLCKKYGDKWLVCAEHLMASLNDINWEEESTRAFFGQWLNGEDLEAAIGWCEALVKNARKHS